MWLALCVHSIFNTTAWIWFPFIKIRTQKLAVLIHVLTLEVFFLAALTTSYHYIWTVTITDLGQLWHDPGASISYNMLLCSALRTQSIFILSENDSYQEYYITIIDFSNSVYQGLAITQSSDEFCTAPWGKGNIMIILRVISWVVKSSECNGSSGLSHSLTPLSRSLEVIAVMLESCWGIYIHHIAAVAEKSFDRALYNYVVLIINKMVSEKWYWTWHHGPRRKVEKRHDRGTSRGENDSSSGKTRSKNK